ncbi:hypothetical protein [Massilia sp. H6]|uniref:hypothetical protein n=1 Tax=Massilia sp. H6 TaxID=2970464 RepID=UPI0021682B91|nr:hypothetical protein [Massilia sp. H6]UVW27244.1 hypothetical protein NRS07_11775 [Massilia sp. H6]
MPSSYELIFRISFGHAFFADGVLRALRIVPVPACHDMLRRAGLLLRAQQDGIAAYGDEQAVNRLRLHIAESGAPLRMAFQVFFTDPHFFEYTAPPWPRGKLLFLDTADAVADDAGRQLLHATPCVPASAFKDRDHADFEHILGKSSVAWAPVPAMVLQVAVSFGLLDAAESNQRQFHVHFDAASTHSKERLQGVAEVQSGIVDLAGEVEFDHHADVNIADDRRAHVFLSRRVVPMREVSPARFRLRTVLPASEAGGNTRMPNSGAGKGSRDNRDGNHIPF